MKKISLSKLNLKEVEQLSREQLKRVIGGGMGSGGGSENPCPEVPCSTTAGQGVGDYCSVPGRRKGTCGWYMSIWGCVALTKC